MAMLNARQMSGQGLTTRARALGFGNGGTGLCVGLLDFRLKRHDVFVAGFLEQIPLKKLLLIRPVNGQAVAPINVANPLRQSATPTALA